MTSVSYYLFLISFQVSFWWKLCWLQVLWISAYWGGKSSDLFHGFSNITDWFVHNYKLNYNELFLLVKNASKLLLCVKKIYLCLCCLPFLYRPNNFANLLKELERVMQWIIVLKDHINNHQIIRFLLQLYTRLLTMNTYHQVKGLIMVINSYP